MTIGSRSSNILRRNDARIQESCEVRFVQECTEGTLSEETYARYLLIEESFVLTAARVAGYFVYSQEDWGGIKRHATTLHTLMTKQLQYFEDLRTCGPATAGPDAERILAASQVLGDYVLRTIESSGSPGALTAMYGAETLYTRWTTHAAGLEVVRLAPLQEWIELHLKDTFANQVQALAEEIDALDEDQITDSMLDEGYVGMLDAEDAFHASLYI